MNDKLEQIKARCEDKHADPWQLKPDLEYLLSLVEQQREEIKQQQVELDNLQATLADFVRPDWVISERDKLRAALEKAENPLVYYANCLCSPGFVCKRCEALAAIREVKQ